MELPMPGRMSPKALARLEKETRARKRRSRAHDKHALDNHNALGARMYFRGVALDGTLIETDWRAFLIAAASEMGMSPVGKAYAWHYPVDGAGGNGATILQPITESFLALDTWPDHRGAYLFICSCKPFHAGCLRDVLRRFGLSIIDAIGAPDCLRLA
jgi:S-adenosylmethionine/arginine decarboxylase-like enzyme